MDKDKQITALKSKVDQALCDSMRDGFMASHHEEFRYRDMHDDKLFPDEFKNSLKAA